MSGATVTQSLDLGEPVKYGERGADCLVCGAAILLHGGCREDVAACNRCKVRMRPECYWGRVAPLAEFQEYRRQIASGRRTIRRTSCARSAGRRVTAREIPRQRHGRDQDNGSMTDKEWLVPIIFEELGQISDDLIANGESLLEHVEASPAYRDRQRRNVSWCSRALAALLN